MSREIKFRIWDIYKKTFIPNGVFAITNSTSKFSYFAIMIEDWENYKIGEYLYPNTQTLMQFTGLKVKNEKDIYEGDILREPPKEHWDTINYSCYEVFFHDGDANSDYNIGYSINRMHNHGAVCGGYIPSFKPKQVSKMIVIGNIYETPQLLQQHL